MKAVQVSGGEKVDSAEAKAKLARRNVSRDVAVHIRSLIVGGVIRARDRIPQDEIAAQLGVSRIPIREALLILESEGLVALVAYRGAFVTQTDRIDIEDHFEVYGFAHGVAARRAASQVDEKLVSHLREVHEKFRNATDSESLDALDWEFHRRINLAGGSGRLKAVLRNLSRLARTIPRGLSLDVATSKTGALREHSSIIDALQVGDPEAAAAACRLHFAEEGQRVLGVMAANGFWSQGPVTTTTPTTS